MEPIEERTFMRAMKAIVIAGRTPVPESEEATFAAAVDEALSTAADLDSSLDFTGAHAAVTAIRTLYQELVALDYGTPEWAAKRLELDASLNSAKVVRADVLRAIRD